MTSWLNLVQIPHEQRYQNSHMRSTDRCGSYKRRAELYNGRLRKRESQLGRHTEGIKRAAGRIVATPRQVSSRTAVVMSLRESQQVPYDMS